MSTTDRVIELARLSWQHPEAVGPLSTGEKCTVGLLMNRNEFLPDGYTFLDAVVRLDPDWLDACIDANRRSWASDLAYRNPE